MLKWIIRSDSNGCITINSRYKKFSIIVKIFYRDVSFPFSITKIYNPRGECNYQQKIDVWSRKEAILKAEEFITSMINDTDVIEISEYLENSHLNYTWVNDTINNKFINLIFGEEIESERFVILVGNNISMSSVAINVFRLRLFNRHGIRKYTI